VLEPAARRLAGGLGPVGFMAGSILGLEAGAISGFLAGRVLGQYEFPVLRPDAPARLLFVAPNLGQAARSLDAPPDQLLRWVALHETTHALQFGGVPWLRGHIAGLVHEMLGALEVDAKQLMRRLPDLSDVKGFVARVREDGFATVVVGEEHRGLLDSVQAFMAVLEGYAEHVMDVTGAQVLDDLPALRSGIQGSRPPPPPPPPHPPPPPRPLGLPAPAGEAARDGPQAAPVRAGQGVLRRRGRPRRDRRSEPGLGGSGAAPDGGRARGPGGLARPYRAARVAPLRLVRTRVLYRTKSRRLYGSFTCVRDGAATKSKRAL
jgi:hypothetical protein